MLIKRTTHLDPLVPLSVQLHILNLFGGDETPYKSLHAVVSCGVKPWSDVFVGTRAGAGKDVGGGGGGAKLGIPMTKNTSTSYAQWKTSPCALISLKRSQTYGQGAGYRMYRIPFPFTTIWLTDLQINHLNLEGYANLKHFAELDKQIQGILLPRLTYIIHVWCAEFDRVDDSDTQRN